MSLPTNSPQQRWLTIALVGVAVIAMDLAISDPRDPAVRVVAQSLAGVTLLSVAHNLVLARGRGLPVSRRWVSAIAVAAMIFPFVFDLVARSLADRGWPTEALTLAALRNLLLLFALFAGNPLFANLAAGASLHGFVFALSLMEQPRGLAVLTSLYLVLGCAWLMARYWSAFEAEARVRGQAVRWPILSFVIFSLVILLLLTMVEVGPRRAEKFLGQWMNSSGGSERYDRFARGGVGREGQDTTDAQDEPSSDGGQGDSYLESHERTFYDVMNERLGEPFLPKHRNRAVALAPEKIQHVENYAKHHQAGRHFELYRRPPPRRHQLASSLQANALLYITGPAPTYIPVCVYDEFDGEKWHSEAVQREYRTLATDWGNWLRLAPLGLNERSHPPYYGASVSHTIKVGGYRARQLPLPVDVYSFRVGAVDRVDFFTFMQTGIVGLSDHEGELPPSEVIDSRAHTTDREKLFRLLWEETRFSPPMLRQLPHEEILGEARAVIEETARRWTDGLPRGWAQIDAIANRLRGGEFHLDPWTSIPDDRDTIAHFLTSSKTGPDYLFSASTVLLLRALGYSSRLVSGYYVDATNYDTWSRTTPVTALDLHFWVEVVLPDGNSVLVEPSPGYILPTYLPTWWERVRQLLMDAATLVTRHPWTFVLILLLVQGLYMGRREVLECLALWRWRWQARGGSQQWINATMRLLETRAWLAGHPRPRGATPRSWFGTRQLLGGVASQALGPDGTLDNLLGLAERAWYAPHARIQLETARPFCRAIAKGWTMARLRAAFSPNANHPKTLQENT